MVLVEQVFYFLFYHSGVHARLRNHGDVADPTRLVEGVAKRAVGYVNGFFFIGGVITSGAGVKRAHHGEVHPADVDALPNRIFPWLEQIGRASCRERVYSWG